MQNIPSNDPRALRCDIIVGTRPEAIKLAPVVKALRESGDDFLVRVVTSGQHGEICRSALAAFGLTADSALGVSPTTDCSCAEPSPIRSPTITSPVAMPTRACGLADLTSRRPTASM